MTVRGEIHPFQTNLTVHYFVSGLTSRLSDLASDGDALTLSLFSDAGSALAAHIVALSRHTKETKLRVVCVGSVWQSWSAMKPGVLSELARRKVSGGRWRV